MKPTLRRRLILACRALSVVAIAEFAVLGAIVALTQPVAQQRRRYVEPKKIVYDRVVAKTVIEVPTGRTWMVAPDGAETITREGDR